MKKVRFESPKKRFLTTKMNDVECHSPRPFLERCALVPPAHLSSFMRVLPYSNDPTQMFETSNSSPYPFVKKTQLCSEDKPNWSPSNELDLSMLDTSYHEPRQAVFCKPILKNCENNAADMKTVIPPILSSIENKTVTPPNVLSDNGFFIRRGNVSNFNVNIVQDHINKMCIDKENDPLGKKTEMMKSLTEHVNKSPPISGNVKQNCCVSCHDAKNIISPTLIPKNRLYQNHTPPNHHNMSNRNHEINHCYCLIPTQPNICSCSKKYLPPRQICLEQCSCDTPNSIPKMNAVDKKTLAIEKFEQNNNSNGMEVEKQMNVKERREPTVSDLFKIIKLQNEQLQLLQEKVDKFIVSSQNNQSEPIQNCSSEHVSIEAVESEQHKISIGVMTSFEMVRTSTIVNKEVLKSCDTQIQCNRSQISIKEIIKAPSANFLEGIAPIDKKAQGNLQKDCCNAANVKSVCDGNEDKTYNELSLYNVHIDTTTPLISPEQSLYLDVRDYSDSDADSDDQSNVGWTYYNKVMTHVNGMLQDSDMPSSASALYRNTRQQMQVQMQIDKTNVSVMKRVKFGDDPLGLHQPQTRTPTDTSLKINQLAAKYLKNGPVVTSKPTPRPAVSRPTTDMSLATRNYMEKHNLLQGNATSSRSPVANEMPRFLDITALKQQPKLL